MLTAVCAAYSLAYNHARSLAGSAAMGVRSLSLLTGRMGGWEMREKNWREKERQYKISLVFIVERNSIVQDSFYVRIFD
jgi:hypothetical protein